MQVLKKQLPSPFREEDMQALSYHPQDLRRGGAKTAMGQRPPDLDLPKKEKTKDLKEQLKVMKEYENIEKIA